MKTTRGLTALLLFAGLLLAVVLQTAQSALASTDAQYSSKSTAYSQTPIWNIAADDDDEGDGSDCNETNTCSALPPGE